MCHRFFTSLICLLLFVMVEMLLFVNIFNINDWQIEVSESSILLSIIGFLLTFAAVYIYSVFHTNVDEEKKRLDESCAIIDNLIKKYESLLENDKRQLDITIIIVRFQTTILAISSTEKMNAQFLEWLDMAKNQVDGFIRLFNDFHDNVSKESFDSVYCELAIIVNNSTHLLESKRRTVSQNDFWKDHRLESTKQTAINYLEDICNKMNDFLNWDFENKRSFVEEPPADNRNESQTKDCFSDKCTLLHFLRSKGLIKTSKRFQKKR